MSVRAPSQLAAVSECKYMKKRLSGFLPGVWSMKTVGCLVSSRHEIKQRYLCKLQVHQQFVSSTGFPNVPCMLKLASAKLLFEVVLPSALLPFPHQLLAVLADPTLTALGMQMMQLLPFHWGLLTSSSPEVLSLTPPRNAWQHAGDVLLSFYSCSL